MKLFEMDVWRKSMDLVVTVYELTARFPNHEMFGLRAQLRRAAVSIPSNVAEGEGRESPREQSRFYLIARGSLYELQTQVAISERLGYLTAAQSAVLVELATRVAMLINGCLRSLAGQT